MRRHALPALLLLLAPAAQAHAVSGNDSPILFGMWHVMVTPLSLLAIAALGSALAYASDRTTAGAILTAGLVATCSAWLLPAGFARAAPAGVIAAGLVAAFMPRPPVPVTRLIGGIAGVAAGVAAAPDQPSLPAALGVGVVTLVLLQGLVEGYQYINRYVPLARRVVGAWMAAIALLLGALALWRPA